MKIHSEKKRKRRKEEYHSSFLEHLLLRMFMTVLLCVGSLLLGYAQTTKTITGKVSEVNGDPVVGASVLIVGTNIGIATDENGSFTLQAASEKDVLQISYLGFVTKRVTVGTNSRFEIILEEDQLKLDEVVVLGYGVQKKESLTGAVVAVQSKELLTTKNTNVQNMLTGKLPGVRNIQRTSEPGVFNNQFDIRGLGSPLLIVDGVPRGDFARLDPNDIETVSVLKDAAAAVYGMRAANGVILVTTKNGEKGKAKIEYSGYYGLQTPAEVLRPNNTHDRGLLFSENYMRNSRSSPNRGRYDDAWFESLAKGEINDTDWYGAALKNSAPQQQHNISVRGGSEKIDYYANFGFTNQESFWTTNASNYDRYNLRTTMNASITNNLKAGIRLNMIYDRTKRQRVGTNEIFKILWRHIPEDPLYANNNPEYLFNGYADHGNVLAILNPDLSGFIDNKRNMFQSNINLEYSFPFVKGLKAEFLYSYDLSFNDNTEYQKQYSTYHYDTANDTYIMSGLYPAAKTNLNRYYANSTSNMWNVRLTYDNTFLDRHRVNALLLYEERYNQGYNFRALRYYDIPIPYLFAGNTDGQIGSGSGLDENANKAVVGRLNYEFEGKYLTEFSFRYDGSSRFPKGKQWGFFPSAQLGYRISEESFIKDNLLFLSNLKLRATWGQTGDDSTGSYQFVEGYDYPTSGAANTLPSGAVFGSTFVNAIGFRNAPNMDITWMKATIYNIGLDADFYGGLFSFSADLFQRDLSDILANPIRNIPRTFGTGISQANLNARRTKGFEVELKHNHRFSDFRYNISGFVQISRSMWTKRDQTERSNSYDNWRNNLVGRWNDVWFGKASNGVYESWEQIENSPFANINTLPGDPIYFDWNGDGIIDGNDDFPIATTTSGDSNRLPSNNPTSEYNYPLMNFGLTLGGSWKIIDFNCMFQGAAMSYVGYVEQLASALTWNGNGLSLHMDRWHPEDPNANPWDPTINWVKGYFPYGNVRAEANSEYNIQKGNYLRMKTAEIGFTIPQKIVLEKLGVKNVRLYVNAYNLLTITGVKGLDPEHPMETWGYIYPLNRTFNFGGSITF